MVAEQELGDPGGGVGRAEIEFVAIVLPERLGAMPTTRAISDSGTKSAKKHFDKIYAFDSAEDAIYLKQGKFPALALGELPNTDTHVTYKNGALAYDGVKFVQFKSGVPASLDDIVIVIYA